MKIELFILVFCLVIKSPGEEVVLPEAAFYQETILYPNGNDGAATATMWFGYYDNIGFDFIDGDAHAQTNEVNGLIDFIGTLFNEPLPPGEMEPNDLIDAMMVYFDVRSDYTMIVTRMDVPRHEGPVSIRYFQYDEAWESYKKEINAGRPIILTVDNGTDGIADHFALGIGYRWYCNIGGVPPVIIQYYAIDPHYLVGGYKWNYYNGACYTSHNCGWGIGRQFLISIVPRQLQTFVDNWLRQDCGPDNEWCAAADINHSGDVNLRDYAEYAMIGDWQ